MTLMTAARTRTPRALVSFAAVPGATHPIRHVAPLDSLFRHDEFSMAPADFVARCGQRTTRLDAGYLELLNLQQISDQIRRRRWPAKWTFEIKALPVSRLLRGVDLADIAPEIVLEARAADEEGNSR
jgi:hypothetical protein